VKLTDQQTKALLAQDFKIVELDTAVAGGQLASLVHEYETAPSDQKQAILQQITQNDPLVVTMGQWGQPTGLNQQQLAIALGGGAAPSEPNSQAAPPVSKIISIITDAHASGATTLAPTPGVQAPVLTVSGFLDDLAKKLRQDGAQDQAARLTRLESQLPPG
jgi:hypothetical protein